MRLFFHFLILLTILSKSKHFINAIPTVNIPAMPGKVVASKIVKTPIKRNRFIIKAMFVINPNILYFINKIE